MEPIAQGDLEKLTGSSGSPINHVYADRISGAMAVLCWSPAAGMSITRGKTLRQLLSAAKSHCGGGLIRKEGVQWGGGAFGKVGG